MALTLQGVEVESPSSNRTLVYMATHGGELRLPFMKRSFISFSYGGKWIEDFGLIAVAKGDGIERGAYATFNDITTDSDVLDGQMYWSTHFRANELEFDLATDAIDQRELEIFLNWFLPGRPRELILAEHSNRAILARVSEPPNLSLAVFEKPISMTFGTNTSLVYNTSTSVYRGHITLKFVMDDPFWYAKNNLLGIAYSLGNGQTYYKDEYIDANGNRVNILSEAGKDALKIVYEDGIPLGSMITSDMILGNGVIARVESHYYNYPSNIILYEDNTTLNGTSNAPFKFNFSANGTIVPDGIGALIAPDSGTDYTSNLSLGDTTWIGVDSNLNDGLPFYYKIVDTNGSSMIIPKEKLYGRTAGAILSDGNITVWPSETPTYFYYCGTAPAPLKISFYLVPLFDNTGYIIEPKNRYSGTGDVYYNTITIVGDGTSELDNLVFRLTAPFMYTSYNHIIKLFELERATSSWVDFEKTLRTAVLHPYARWAAIQLGNFFTLNLGTGWSLSDVNFASFIELLKYKMFGLESMTDHKAMFTFDSTTGAATVKYEGVDFNYDTKRVKDPYTLHRTGYDDRGWGILEEDAGDMLLSNKLYVTDRNYFNSINLIDHFYNDADRRHYSHYIKHNFNLTLTNVSLEYLNLYL